MAASKKPPFVHVFGDQLHAAHIKGQDYRKLFVETVHNFFKRMKHHLYVAGQPGVGKTYTVELIAKNYPDVYLLILKGKMTPWAFIKQVAVAMHTLPKNKKLVIFIDDMNEMFKSSSDFLDMFKIAMDKKSGDRLEYNTSLGAQFAACEEIEKAAIEYFKSLDPNRTGFAIPFNGRVKFIFTMNTPLPGAQELAKEKQGSDRWIKLNNRSAIRSRVEYEDLVMDKETHWGWISDVVWNEPKSMCVGATPDQRYEILVWLWDNWQSVSEHSLRFVEEKMWDIMEQYPDRNQYRRRWEKLKG
jgi:DNA polymerase III delta prime subunit